MKGSAAVVHEDILRMAKTEEERERIKWLHARKSLCTWEKKLSETLVLARHSSHPDARFLVSLFPEGAPPAREDVANVFLSHTNDPRCVCWAAMVGAPDVSGLMLRAAKGGDSLAQATCGSLKLEGLGAEREMCWRRHWPRTSPKPWLALLLARSKMRTVETVRGFTI